MVDKVDKITDTLSTADQNYWALLNYDTDMLREDANKLRNYVSKIISDAGEKSAKDKDLSQAITAMAMAAQHIDILESKNKNPAIVQIMSIQDDDRIYGLSADSDVYVHMKEGWVMLRYV